MSTENRLSVGTVIYLYDPNSVDKFQNFVIVSLSPRFLVFRIVKELGSFVLMSSELMSSQMELREDVLRGCWIDCTTVVEYFDFQEIVSSTRTRSNVIVGKLSQAEIDKLGQTILTSETLESLLISELSRGFRSIR